jgi:hypothetical protein
MPGQDREKRQDEKIESTTYSSGWEPVSIEFQAAPREQAQSPLPRTWSTEVIVNDGDVASDSLGSCLSEWKPASSESKVEGPEGVQFPLFRTWSTEVIVSDDEFASPPERSQRKQPRPRS